VKSTTIEYNGVIHDFGLLNPLAEIPQVKDLFIQASAQLREYLKKIHQLGACYSRQKRYAKQSLACRHYKFLHTK